MSGFFNGANAAEVAGLNVSTSSLNINVKTFLSKEENVAAMQGILDEDLPEFDKDVRLVSTAMEMDPVLQNYTMHDVRATLTRRLNTASRQIAKKHGFGRYLRYSRGKVKEAELQLTHDSTSIK